MHRVSVVLQDWMTGTEQDWSSPVEEDDVEEDDVEMTGEGSGEVSRVDEDPFENEMCLANETSVVSLFPWIFLSFPGCLDKVSLFSWIMCP